VEVITHDFDGEVRWALAFVIRSVCVGIGKVKVRLDVICGVGSKAE